jgi:hypothetical protein
MNELIDQGYVFRYQIKEKGKFKDVIYVFNDNKEEVKEAIQELKSQEIITHPENQETDQPRARSTSVHLKFRAARTSIILPSQNGTDEIWRHKYVAFLMPSALPNMHSVK